MIVNDMGERKIKDEIGRLLPSEVFAKVHEFLTVPDIFIDHFGAGVIMTASFETSLGIAVHAFDVRPVPFDLMREDLRSFTMVSTYEPRPNWERNRRKSFLLYPEEVLEVPLPSLGSNVDYDHSVHEVVRALQGLHFGDGFNMPNENDLGDLSYVIQKINPSTDRRTGKIKPFEGPNRDRETAIERLTEILYRERNRRELFDITAKDIEDLVEDIL